MTANDLPESAATHIVRASLKARLYRDIEIASTASLYGLGEAIVHSFDFELDHAFGFFSKFTGNFYRSPVRYELLADTGFETESESDSNRPANIHPFDLVGESGSSGHFMWLPGVATSA